MQFHHIFDWDLLKKYIEIEICSKPGNERLCSVQQANRPGGEKPLEGVHV